MQHLNERYPSDPEVAVEHAAYRLQDLLEAKHQWSEDMQSRAALALPYINRIRPWCYVGRLEFVQGQMSDAIVALRRSMNRSPADDLLLATAHAELAQDDEAKQVFENAWLKLEEDGLAELSDDMEIKLFELGKRWPDICSPQRRAALSLYMGDWSRAAEQYAKLAAMEPHNKEWKRRRQQIAEETVTTLNFDFGTESVSIFGGSSDIRGDGTLTVTPIPAPGCSLIFWQDALRLSPGIYELTIRMHSRTNLRGLLAGGTPKNQLVASTMELAGSNSMRDYRTLFSIDRAMTGLSLEIMGGLKSTLQIDAVTLKRSSLADAEAWIQKNLAGALPQVQHLDASLHLQQATKSESRGDLDSAIQELIAAESAASKLFGPIWEEDIDSISGFELIERIAGYSGGAGLLFQIKSAKIRLKKGELTVPKHALTGVETAFGPDIFFYLAYPLMLEGQTERAQIMAKLPERFLEIAPPNFATRMIFNCAVFHHWNQDQVECLRLVRLGIESLSRQGNLGPDFEEEIPLEAIRGGLEFAPDAADLHEATARLLAIRGPAEELRDAMTHWHRLRPEIESQDLFKRLSERLKQLEAQAAQSKSTTLTWHAAALQMERQAEDKAQADSLLWMQCASLSAAAVQRGQADQAEHVRIAEKMIKLFGHSGSPFDVERTLKACYLLESRLDISDISVDHIMNSLSSGQIDPRFVPFFEFVLGLRALRKQSYDQTLKYCKAALQSADRASEYKYAVDPAALAVMSAAYVHTNQLDEALKALNAAQTNLNQLIDRGVYVGSNTGIEPARNVNHDIVIAQLLIEQAEALLQIERAVEPGPRT